MLRDIESAIDAALASERSRRARTEPEYKRMWLEVKILCGDCEDGESYFRRLANRRDGGRFFACTNELCDRVMSSSDYCMGKGAVVAALVDGNEPPYDFFRESYRRKR